MDLLDEFADGSGQWQWPFHHVFLDGVWGFVGHEVEARFFLALLFLDGEGAKADCEDADAMVAYFESQAWHEFVVDDVVGEHHVAELAEGWHLCAELCKEHLEGDLSG